MLLYELIETPKSKFLYDTTINKLCKINNNQYEFLKKFKNCENVHIIQQDSLCKNLMDSGFLRKSPIEKIEHPDTKILEKLTHNSMAQMTLQLTQNCNLRCSYCVYSGNYYNRTHNNLKMDFETAKKSLRYFFANSSHNKELAIGFYGGEPLLCFKFIKKCVDYAENINPGKKLYFTITTNGTLLTKEVSKYLMNHNFHITLSLDGPEEQHNKNRTFVNGKGSFNKILNNLENISKEYPEFVEYITINNVITPQHDLEQLMHFFDEHPKFKQLETQFVEVDQTDIKDDKYQSFPDKYIIIKRYLYFLYLLSLIGMYPKDKLSKLTPGNEYLTNLFYQNIKNSAGSERTCHHGGPCTPGVHKLFVDSKGNLFPCERLNEESQEVCLGSIDSGININKSKNILNIGSITENECKNCWCINLCDMCVKKTLSHGKISKSQKLEACIITKQQKYNALREICLLNDFNYIFKESL